MEPDVLIVECEVQIFGQKVCQICNETDCWGESIHEQPKEDQERLEDSVLKTIRAAK
jgi:hypothetical protein